MKWSFTKTLFPSYNQRHCQYTYLIRNKKASQAIDMYMYMVRWWVPFWGQKNPSSLRAAYGPVVCLKFTKTVYFSSYAWVRRKKEDEQNRNFQVLRIDGDSNDKPMAMQSWSVARSQWWETVLIGTRLFSAPDVNSTDHNQPWKRPAMKSRPGSLLTFQDSRLISTLLG